jgi:uncharacterized protein (TIGR00255 family)
MTAFARQESQHSWGGLVWEIRSVNHRYLESNLRIPDSIRDIESALRDQLRKKLNRGKIDCSLRFDVEKKQQGIQVDETRAKQLIAAAEQLNQFTSNPQPIDTLEILRWPGVMLDTKLDMSEVKQAALQLFSQAIDDLNRGRIREGAELAELITQRLDTISQVVAQVRSQMPSIIDAQRNLLQSRVIDLQLEIDPLRIEQEIALLAQKADVAEELDRLDTHVQEVRRILQQKGAIGRRLDFLMQELNREANTLTSKAIVVDTTNSAVELKVLIEQMREQIQNIE